MKILKISLQNINSLKSEEPICIDFEGSVFKNVGLYAITGPTGAGKTTLLDAITIALYHQVPRFNNAHSKGLEHVVSYGAAKAFSSVVFENNNIKHEVYWGISLKTSNGKKRATPQEVVRLKNLSTDKIIAEKKREVRQEIERITSLSYEQFLRSILLAQGDFAAFLSAKGADKAKLLEQITGEEIYKKVGETIQQRKAVEKRKLEDLTLMVDDKNLLSSEEVSQKKKEQKEIVNELENISKNKIIFDKAKSWYLEEKKLNLDKEKIQQQLEKLEADKNRRKNDLLLLEKDTLAQPFKESLLLMDQGREAIKKQEVDLEKNQKELLAIVDVEKKTQLIVDEKQQGLNKAENTYKVWEPKLEKVVVLESEIKSTQTQLKKDEEQQSIYDEKQIVLQTEIKKKTQELETLENLIIPLKLYLEKSKSIPAIEKEFLQWNKDYTVLKGKEKETLVLEKKVKEIESSSFSLQKEIELSFNDIKNVNKEYLDKKNKLKKLNDVLEVQNITKLLKIKEEQDIQLKKWLDFKEIAKLYHLKKIDYSNLEKQNKQLNSLLLPLYTQKELLEKEEKKAIQIIAYEELIWKQEKLILSYEEERKKLIKGASCFVCGSKEHPYIDGYLKVESSDTDKKLLVAKENREKITLELKKLDFEITTKATQLKEQKVQLGLIKQELSVFLENKKKFEFLIDFSETDAIEKEIVSLLNCVKLTKKAIYANQEKSKEKDVLSKDISTILEKLNRLETKGTKLVSNQENNKQQIQEFSLVMNALKKEIKLLKTVLNTAFQKNGFLNVSDDKVGEFLESCSQDITKYHQTKEQLLKSENKIEGLKTMISNSENLIKEVELSLGKVKNIVGGLWKEVKEKQEQRNTILPEKHNVDATRKRLDSLVLDAKKEVEIATKTAINYKQKLTELATKQKGTEKNIEELRLSLKNIKIKIEKELKASCFEGIDDVKQALLDIGKRSDFLDVEKRLKTEEEVVKNLKTRNQRDLKQLYSTNKNTISEHEIDEHLKNYTSTLQVLSSTSGRLEKELEQNEQFIEANKKLISQIYTQKKECSKWSRLLLILGGSKDAFNIYVQRLTLKNLIDLANIHLYKLNKRYSLQLDAKYSKGEELSFKLLDHYQADQVRSVDTCSGGERFLISLALALGLSDLASNNVKIDSLFIDEGFGTLDGSTLETVIVTLENLQSQGKKIGVISHVESLKERITTQIQLQKTGQGVSRLDIV